jgi:hypothetical protein
MTTQQTIERILLALVAGLTAWGASQFALTLPAIMLAVTAALAGYAVPRTPKEVTSVGMHEPTRVA